VIERCTERGLSMTGRVQSVAEQRVARVRSIRPAHPVRCPEGQQIARSIGRGARPITIDRTRTVASVCLLETTGR
jgi:hypothetical protein